MYEVSDSQDTESRPGEALGMIPVSQSTELALTVLAEQAQAYATASRSSNTRRAYAAQMRAFEAFCVPLGLSPLPAKGATIAVYLSSRAGQGASVSTCDQALAAIVSAHEDAGHAAPKHDQAVVKVMQGIRNTLRDRKPRQAHAVTPAQLRLMVKGCSTRDRALLLLGFAGGFRRSEVVGLNISDLVEDQDGLKVTIRHSKTDQTGEGRTVGIPYGSDPGTCAVRAVKALLVECGRPEGPLFIASRKNGQRLQGMDVSRVLKRAAERAGLDAGQLSGHSLRRGLATAAARAGKSPASIMKQTGHRSVGMVMRYIEESELFTDNAASGIGL